LKALMNCVLISVLVISGRVDRVATLSC
jgi:hypothetical protein